MTVGRVQGIGQQQMQAAQEGKTVSSPEEGRTLITTFLRDLIVKEILRRVNVSPRPVFGLVLGRESSPEVAEALLDGSLGLLGL